jgi:predicted nucleotidyltransferase
VDLLVDFEPGRDLLDLVALKQDLEQLLGCHVDIVEEEGLNPRLVGGSAGAIRRGAISYDAPLIASRPAA